MVRLLQVDETVQEYADERVLKRTDIEIGALVGRSAAGRDVVLQLVRCPDQDGEPPLFVKPAAAPSKKGGAKGKAASGGLELDQEWVVEHAAQVARLLPGGLSVMGLYLFCPDGAFTGGAAVVGNALREAAAAVSAPSDGMLAFNIDSVSGRMSAKELTGASLRPCDVKVASVLSQMVGARCRYSLDVRVNAADGRQRLHAAVAAAARWECEQRLGAAIGLVNGQLAGAGQQVADVLSNGGQTTLSVELLAPLPAAALASVGATAGEVLQHGKGRFLSVGEVVLSGVLDCRACVHRREPAAAVIDAIKADLACTLQARLEVLVDAAEMAMAVQRDRQEKERDTTAAPSHPLLRRLGEGMPFAPLLPHRAVVGWAAGGGCYFDYLVEGEGQAETLQRLQELVGAAAIDPASFECDEAPAGAAGGRGQGGGVLAALTGCNVAVMGAAGAALLAAGVGYLALGS